jgi:Flp pilus assembly protein TadD
VCGCFSKVTRCIRQIVWGCVAAILIAATWSTASAQQTAKAKESVDAQTRLGMLAVQANNLKEAEKHFAAAASLAPTEPSTRNNYGAILMRLGRTAEARAEFEASLKLNPDQPNALTNLAQIYFYSSQPDDLRMARTLLERAEKSGSDPEVSRALGVAYLKLGQTLIEKGLLDEAIAELSDALAFDPRNADLVVSLSRAYMLKKDLHAAGRTLESAVANGFDDASMPYRRCDLQCSAIRRMRLTVFVTVCCL